MDEQFLYNMIAILTKKLGGNVTVTFAELENPPVATVHRDNVHNQLTVTTEE